MTPNEKLMIRELNSKGLNYENIIAIHNAKFLEPAAVDIILKWLPSIYEDQIGSGEHLIRALISAVEPFDPSVIIQLFENSSYNKSIKWTMAYVLSVSRTQDISNYIKNQLLNHESSFERSGFLYWIERNTKVFENSELLELLKTLFDKYFHFGYYQKLFKKYAQLKDVSFLEEKLRNPNLRDYLNYTTIADATFGGSQAKDVNKKFDREVRKMIESIKSNGKFNRSKT